MKALPANSLMTLGVLGVLALVAYVVLRGPGGVAKDGSKAAVNVLAGLVTGTVIGVGEAVGIPETDQSKCQKALAEGRYWDASFDCAASDFVKGLVGTGKSGAVAAKVADGSYYDP